MTDEFFMRLALQEARRAYEAGEVPIGAVITFGDRVIGKGHNQVERLQDPTAHAEILAITAACDALGSKFLQDCTVYVTIEPCLMCAGALRWAQASRIVFGAEEPKTGFSRFGENLLHPRSLCVGGVLEAECRELMQAFFRERR